MKTVYYIIRCGSTTSYEDTEKAARKLAETLAERCGHATYAPVVEYAHGARFEQKRIDVYAK